MRKKFLICTILLAALPLTSQGAGPVKPEEAVRERANNFNKRLLEAKYDDAVKFVDPDVLAQTGEKPIKEQLKGLMGLAKGLNALVGRKVADFRVHNIKLNKEKTEATMDVSFCTANAAGNGNRQWGEANEEKWVLKNKEWYLKLGE